MPVQEVLFYMKIVTYYQIKPKSISAVFDSAGAGARLKFLIQNVIYFICSRNIHLSITLVIWNHSQCGLFIFPYFKQKLNAALRGGPVLVPEKVCFNFCFKNWLLEEVQLVTNLKCNRLSSKSHVRVVTFFAEKPLRCWKNQDGSSHTHIHTHTHTHIYTYTHTHMFISFRKLITGIHRNVYEMLYILHNMQ